LQLNLDGSDNEDTPTNQELIPNDLGLEIIRGGGDEMSDETWRNIEEGAPSKVDVMKNVSLYTIMLMQSDVAMLMCTASGMLCKTISLVMLP
jgi:hypothetical protein